MRGRTAAVIALSALLALTGCATSADAGTDLTGDSSSTSAAPELTGDLTVYAAASLAGAFDDLATAFEQRNPSVDVQPVVYDGSQVLATQIEAGAPADVFASADEKTMAKIGDLATGPELFASNTLVLVVPAGNPGGVTGLADLARPGLTVVLCAPEVPCGAASQTLLANQGVSVTPASSEQNVTAVLTKVAAGEADAGLVYATDVVGRDDVESTVPDGAAEVVNHYPITAVTASANPDAAAAFIAFVLSDEGQGILSDAGFGVP